MPQSFPADAPEVLLPPQFLGATVKTFLSMESCYMPSSLRREHGEELSAPYVAITRRYPEKLMKIGKHLRLES